MPARAKSWSDKLTAPKGLPKLVKLDARIAARWGAKDGDLMLVPAPLQVDALMRIVPRGKLITTNEIRESLARQNGATLTCPLTTGIFSWIAAHAAAESNAGVPADRNAGVPARFGKKDSRTTLRVPGAKTALPKLPKANDPPPANPYWRTLKSNGEINPKFPGGPTAIARLLRAEGHRILKKGTRYFVPNYAQSLAPLP
jgi:hypothetical protein